MKNIKQTRDANVELLRIILMFGICLLHCTCQGQYFRFFPTNLLQVCVPTFVFISGFFGIRFRFSKVIRLYLMAIYASLLVPLIGGSTTCRGYWAEVLRVWDADKGFWFLHAYVIVMALSPIVDPLFCLPRTRENVLKVLGGILPIVWVFCVWGALRGYAPLRLYVPNSNAFQMGFFNLFGMYIVGKSFSYFRLDERVSFKFAVFSCLLLLSIMSIRYNWFSPMNNPVCVAASSMLFVVFRSVHVPKCLIAPIMFLSPLMFIVYCFNGNLYLPGLPSEPFALINRVMEWGICLKLPYFIVALQSALVVFVFSLILALPFKFCKLDILKKADDIYERFISCLADKLGFSV